MKILAASTPDYFPKSDFFLKMELADKFVIADDFQFSTNSTVNRTRIKTESGWQWITVPVFSTGKLKQKINDVKIVTGHTWQRKHFRIIKSNYKYSPYYDYFEPYIEQIYCQSWDSLFELNQFIIELLMKIIQINSPVYFSSDIKSDKKGTDNIIEIVRYFECDHYLIIQDEIKYIDEKKLNESGIKLIIKNYIESKYFQQFKPFDSGLSVLDLLLNKGNEAKSIILSGMNKSQCY